MDNPLSILIVEDEPLIAMMLEDFLLELGHQVVGTVDSVEGAMQRVEEGGFDFAVLDIHLRGGATSWKVADTLADRAIPFVFATGGHVDQPPARHASVAELLKPFTMDGVRAALEGAIPPAGS